MTDLLSTLQLVLRDAGYRCGLVKVARQTVVLFEDDTLMGFGHVFDSTRALVDEWQSQEAATLSLFASRFRQANDKAWNIYSVFVCASGADEEEAVQVRLIEENLEQTRKIAAFGAVTMGDVTTALLPILPLQFRPQLEQEDYSGRLKRRISGIAPEVVDIALDDQVSPADIALVLGRRA